MRNKFFLFAHSSHIRQMLKNSICVSVFFPFFFSFFQIENRTPIAKAFVESAISLNHSEVNYNSGDQIGVSYLQSSTKNGWRQTAARAFLSPIRNRHNLDISLRSWATKLLFNADGDRVKAIKFVRNKREYTIKIRKEAILAAGAFESPKLLMLSGIGPEQHLNDLNIKIIKVRCHFESNHLTI